MDDPKQMRQSKKVCSSVACIDFAASGEGEERRWEGEGKEELRGESPDALFLTDFVHSVMVSGLGMEVGRVSLDFVFN